MAPRQGFWRLVRDRADSLDRLTVGWIATFAVGVVGFGRGDSSWVPLFLAHAGLIAVIIWMVCRFSDRTGGVMGFFRHLYPALLYSFFYREMAAATFWVFPEFLDDRVIAFEHALFGADPNIWITFAQTAWANEIMMLGYFSYYLLIPIVAIPLFLQRRIAELRAMLLSTTTAFVLSYICFVLFPVEGPRYHLAGHFAEPLSGWVFVPLVNAIISHGAIHGGCMPSSHVAVALVVLVWTRRSMPRLGMALTPFAFLLFFGTAWGRFHYITDVVVGLLVGIMALVMTRSYASVTSKVRSTLVTPGGEISVLSRSTSAQ